MQLLDHVLVVPEGHAAQAGWGLITGIKVLVAATDGANRCVLIVAGQIEKGLRVINGGGVREDDDLARGFLDPVILRVGLAATLRHPNQTNAAVRKCFYDFIRAVGGAI